MRFFIICLTIMAVVVCVQCNIVLAPDAFYFNINPIAKVDNYILQYQRQFEAHLRSMDKYLEDFSKKFELRLEMIKYYDGVVDVKLRDLQDKFDPLEMLGDINEMCVEKYRCKMPADNNLKSNLKACINKATTAFSSLIINPENTLKNIRNHYNNQFNHSIAECKKKFEKDQTKYKLCATTAIQNANTYFNTNTKTFYSQITAADCSANAKIDEAFDCYSQNVYQAFTAIGEVNGLIENCLAGHDFCAACEIDANDIIKGRCPYQIAWHLVDNDLTSDKIVNPFKGLNKTTQCLQINFISKNIMDSVNRK